MPPERPRWWIYVGALVLVAFLFSLTGSLLITAISAALLGLLAVYLVRQPNPPKAHYCRQCGETLNRNARQCQHCGSASWSIRD